MLAPMLLRSTSLRAGQRVRSYSPLLLGGAMFFGLFAALVPLGAARAVWAGDVAEAILVSVLGLLALAGAYAFARTHRSAIVACRREGRQLRITTASGAMDVEVGEAALFVRKTMPTGQHLLPHHEVCLTLPRPQDSVVLCGSLLARRAQRQAELLAAHLDLAITREPDAAPHLEARLGRG
jgi:hypothetical protein